MTDTPHAPRERSEEKNTPGLGWLPAHKYGLYLTHNEHRDVYESIEAWTSDWDADDFVPDEQEKVLESGELWTLQWYPDTPIGFYRISAASLEALAKHMHARADRRASTEGSDERVDWPSDVPLYVPLTGWMHRGPDYSQGFNGWKVFAHPPSTNDGLPVTITPGHHRASSVSDEARERSNAEG